MQRRTTRFATRLWCMLVLCMLVLAGCGTQQSSGEQPQPGGASPTVQEPLPPLGPDSYPRIDGSTANLPLIMQLHSLFWQVLIEEAGMVVDVSGTYNAWAALLEKETDLLVVYEAPEALWQRYPGGQSGLEIVPLGRDGLVFLADKENPVDGLTQEELRGIYTGEITSWQQVGGEEKRIAAFQRNETSGSQTLFLKLLMGDVEPMEPQKQYSIGAMSELIDEVAAFDSAEGALGFSVYYYASDMYANPNIKLLAVDGVHPSDESIYDGSYPLINEYYVVIRADEAEDSPARQLRDWLLGPAGSELLWETGYVPVNG